MLALFRFGQRERAAPDPDALRRDHWARVHIAADRREPFDHRQPRRPDAVIGCPCCQGAR